VPLGFGQFGWRRNRVAPGLKRCFGLDAAMVTAFAKNPAGIDWESIFGSRGARRFHAGGIFCAFSETTPELALEAMQVAHKFDVVVSYDLHYRDSLWRSFGGKKRAQESIAVSLLTLV
jgi:2-dehydro-3-deoxygluconokinase